MIYRMKQNAVGLANICILSTMVLVMVSSTASLMIGIEEIMNERYPYHISYRGYAISDESLNRIVEIVNETAEKENVTIKRQAAYSSLEFSAVYSGGDEFIVSSSQDVTMMNSICSINIITAEDYTRSTGKEITLDDDQVLFWTHRLSFKDDHFILFGKRYEIAEQIDKFVGSGIYSVSMFPYVGIIVKDRTAIEAIAAEQEKVYGKNASSVVSYCYVDIDGNAEAQIDFYRKVWENVEPYIDEADIAISSDCRELAKASTLELYGSLFFLGMFLGLLFTMATVLIIYYKQISEGFDDKSRFEIMQKVGLDQQEIKKSIHSQILTVFFLPLALAGVHITFAFPIIKKLLSMFALNNTLLYAMTTVGTFLVFTLIYAAIYSLTAKAYYGIVRISK